MPFSSIPTQSCAESAGEITTTLILPIAAPLRRTSVKRVALAIDRFQPDTFLLGRVHAETFYQTVIAEAKCLRWRASAAGPRESGKPWRDPSYAALRNL